MQRGAIMNRLPCCLLLLVLVPLLPFLPLTPKLAGLDPAPARPNIVLVLSDDQDLVLGGMTPLKHVQQLLGQQGVTFENAFATTPICCPSRASILTGRHLHNTGVVNNTLEGNCSSHEWQQGLEMETLAVHLKALNYTTFYAGKYMNQYGKKHAGGTKHVPAGWDWWMGLTGNSRYYNYTLSINGTARRHGDSYATDYLTDVIARSALQFIQQQNLNGAPFFMILAVPAPHAPFTPAPQYEHRYEEIKAPRTYGFDAIPGTDKHWLLRLPPSPLPNVTVDVVDEVHRNRWRTLLSVDHMVRNIMQVISMVSTYVVFTSDHGYHLGQNSMPWDKRQPYDTDLRVPLLVQGPGIPKGVKRSEMVLLIDLFPTLLEMAGKRAANTDGMSFFEIAKGESQEWRTAFLVEYRGEGGGKTDPECPWRGTDVTLCQEAASCKCQDSTNNTYDCVRQISPQANFLFCQFEDSEGFQEAYNITSDPYQLTNIAPALNEKTHRHYKSLLKRLKGCSGRDCWVTDF